jgi:glycerol-3-phosphate dehydrogenase
MDAAFAILRTMSPNGVPLDYRRYGPNDLSEVPFAPWLRDSAKLRSVAVFREYQFDWAERIALDALFDARRMGAHIHNYTRVEGLERITSKDRWRLSLRFANETAQVTANLVLNIAGAWVDRIIQKAGSTTEPKGIGLKGIHIAVRLPDEFTDWGLFAYNSIGEPLYCLPWRGMHYIGLTRTPFAGDAAGVVASDEEIDWMIGETNRCLPKLALTRSDVLFTWAGVQPVTFDPQDPKGNREIKIHDLAADGLPGILTLTGGPIMTHRRVAKRLVRAVSNRMSPSGSPQDLSFQSDDPAAEQNAPRIVSETASVSTLAVERCARDEQPRSLADLLMRRLGLGWASDQGLALARPVAEAAAPHLGWSEGRIETEINAYRTHLNTARRRPSPGRWHLPGSTIQS